MNNTLSKFLIFTAGAAIGSVVTWKLVKTKYEKIANEEIESVREYYANKNKEKLTDEAYGEDDEEPDGSGREEYETLVRDMGYSGENKKEEAKVEDNRPYVISPEEYEDSDYNTEALDYYEGDGVLVDAYGDVVENVDELVGADFASHFGEYERDTVYVRNDETEIDYEICRDLRSYSEVN